MRDVGPQVFISFAGSDLETAQRLKSDLETLQIRTFLSNHDTKPGQLLPVRISEGLRQSDYFVLLLSKVSVQREWVQQEWSAALTREINTRRAFLFVLRIDETQPPDLLAGRLHLDGHRDWAGSVRRLVEAWTRDGSSAAQNVCVLPPPNPPKEYDPRKMGLFLYNRALNVRHFLQVDPQLTGRQLETVTHSQLALKDHISTMGGKLGLRFRYELQFQCRQVALDRPLEESGLKDNDELELVVTMEQFGPSVPVQEVVFRTGCRPEQWVGNLALKAFQHLLP